MSLKESGFRFVERGFDKVIVLIPGWATDYRIFANLELDYNYLLTLGVSPFEFKPRLLDYLQEISCKRISLFGYSLGGFLAADFAAEYPALIDELILVSIRKSYGSRVLEETRQGIKNNASAFLYKFYLNCFSSEDKNSLAWFRKNILKSYINDISLDGLLSGLDYLSSASIDADKIRNVKKIRLFHGQKDLIAPYAEALKIKSELTKAFLTPLDKRGHLLFLDKQFREEFYHGQQDHNK